MRATQIYINQSALQHNLNRVRQLAPHAKVVSMVKANAYGHGIKHCLPALVNSDAFGVACLEEALQIRNLGYQQDITLIEGVFSADEMPEVLKHRLECVIHHQQQLDWLINHQQAYQAQNLKVWLKLNSGMNRLGFTFEALIHATQRCISLGFDCVITMHFANADEPNHPLNQKQIEQFQQLRALFPQLKFSCCNSAAIFNWQDLHLDYVRPGIMLYGASPFAHQNIHALNLHPVMHFTTQIMAIHQLAKGEKIGYGSSITTERETTLAIIAVGYGDGYPRTYQTQNYVSIQGHLAPLFGRVSMDMIMVDISDLIAQGLSINIGTTVELWGEHRLVDDVAQTNGTIGYELLCKVTQRPHFYTNRN